MNTNVLRAVTNKLRDLQTAGVQAQAVAIGNKGLGFRTALGARWLRSPLVWATPASGQAHRPGQGAADAHAEGKINAGVLAYTKFINTMKQESVVEQLLPCPPSRCRPTSPVTVGTTSMSPTLRA